MYLNLSITEIIDVYENKNAYERFYLKIIFFQFYMIRIDYRYKQIVLKYQLPQKKI